jgi:hypothetical protein
MSEDYKRLSMPTQFAVLLACCLAAGLIPFERLIPGLDAVAVLSCVVIKGALALLFFDLVANRRRKSPAGASKTVRVSA